MDGELLSVDGRRGRLQVRSGRGRTSTVFVDRATRVLYRQRSYPVDALERGDVVRVWVEVDGRGEAWADRVEVRQSVRDRYSSARRLERIEGRVGAVSQRGHYFTVDVTANRAVVVHFADSRIDREEIRRIERLRRGDRIRADVRLLAGGGAELVRLR